MTRPSQSRHGQNTLLIRSATSANKNKAVPPKSMKALRAQSHYLSLCFPHISDKPSHNIKSGSAHLSTTGGTISLVDSPAGVKMCEKSKTRVVFFDDFVKRQEENRARNETKRRYGANRCVYVCARGAV